jgi:hypothetical protein
MISSLIRRCMVATAAVGAALALAPSPAFALTEALPGPPPPSCGALFPGQCLIQTRNGGFSLSSHVVRAGGTITGIVTNRCLYQQGTAPCPIDWSAMGPIGRRVSGCRPQDASCTIRIARNAQSDAYYVVNIGITSDQGVGWSSDYYAVVGQGSALIRGTVTNRDQDPVGGVAVAMFGGQVGNYTATSGPDGSYAADVNAGGYRVVPSGRSLSTGHPPGFTPQHTDVSASAGRGTRADFTAGIGLVVKLTLSPAGVPADGLHIVQGRIAVTELGRPKPGVTVALWPKAMGPAAAAVTSGARANVCGPTGRIWPGGSLTAPAGGSVDVLTDSTGTYRFTLDVGTVPGSFPLTAWARDGHGQLITQDRANASSAQTVSVSPLGSETVDQFVSTYDARARSSNAAAGISADPSSVLNTLAQLTAGPGPLKGYAYALGQGTSPSVLVYPAASPPMVQPSGAVVADSGDLVLQPSAWVGVPGAAGPDLAKVLQGGTLPGLPTLAQWAQGTTISGWKTTPQAFQVASPSFAYFGWPYPSSAAGACS